MEVLYHLMNNEKNSCAGQISAAAQRQTEMRATFSIVANEQEVSPFSPHSPDQFQNESHHNSAQHGLIAFKHIMCR